METNGNHICAWCGKILEGFEGHGMCKDCFDIQVKKIKKLRKNLDAKKNPSIYFEEIEKIRSY
jgi:NMD protein affecting ribosome stability and mRNA decay